MRSLVALKDSRLVLHKVFLPPTERPRAQPLLHWADSSDDAEKEDPELYKDVWWISNRRRSCIPALVESAGDVPCLSDSESDDDDNEHTKRSRCPTWRDAETLFEEDTEVAASSEGSITSGYEPGELLGVPQGVADFPRYHHMVRLERSYNTHREELLQLLPNVRLLLLASGYTLWGVLP
jgi:hypothetical protein